MTCFRRVAWMVVAIVACCSDARTSQGAEPTWTVVTWNLEWFFDDVKGDNYSELAQQQAAPSRDAWNWKRDTVASAIASLNADLVALQEIESGRVLGYLTQAIERERRQRFRVAFAEGNDRFTEQDVGFLYRNTDILQVVRRMQTQAMYESGNYYDLSKHLEIEAVVDPKDAREPVTVITIHLRATQESAELRLRQARLLRHWIQGRIRQGMNLIVLGDTNCEVPAGQITANDELGMICGMETADPSDDLVDLHERIPESERQTHLIRGKQYDRILVSRTLLQDDPARRDLVLREVRVRRDVAIRGAGADDSQQHWEHYWEVPNAERDVSDHYPVEAVFELR